MKHKETKMDQEPIMTEMRMIRWAIYVAVAMIATFLGAFVFLKGCHVEKPKDLIEIKALGDLAPHARGNLTEMGNDASHDERSMFVIPVLANVIRHANASPMPFIRAIQREKDTRGSKFVETSESFLGRLKQRIEKLLGR